MSHIEILGKASRWFRVERARPEIRPAVGRLTSRSRRESAKGGAARSNPAPAATGVGEPDAHERLWAPHRLSYVQKESTGETSGAEQCPFCAVTELGDEEGLIVKRGRSAFVVLNTYPYNNGHLLVIPYRHVADYEELTPAEADELWRLTRQALAALRAAASAQGFNLGMNLGAVAGAGIPSHLHQHVVPRWGGDTNFMPVVGQTMILPQLLEDTRAMLAEVWSTGLD